MLPSDQALAFATAFGLIVGSYLNVVAYRLPRGVSTVYPGSRCPRCVMPVRPWDNVPVLGYLWLLGRCRDCGMAISPRYPLIEAGGGVWFALCFMRASSLLEQVAASLFGALLIALALIDFDHHRVPVAVVALAVVVGVAAQPWLMWAEAGLLGTGRPAYLIAGAAGAAGAFLGMKTFSALGEWIGIEEGLASGDALALGMIGAFLGLPGAAMCFVFASALALCVALPNVVLARRSVRQPVPFVTYLSLGAALVLIAGPLGARP